MTSVILLFNHSEEINIENLFLIFQSYLKTPEALIKGIFIIAENSKEDFYNKKIPVFHNIRIEILNKMTYLDFLQ